VAWRTPRTAAPENREATGAVWNGPRAFSFSSTTKGVPLAPRKQGKAPDPATAPAAADDRRRHPGPVVRRVSGHGRDGLPAHPDQGSGSAHDGDGSASGARHVTACSGLAVWNGGAPDRLTSCHREERMNRLRTRPPPAVLMGGRHAFL